MTRLAMFAALGLTLGLSPIAASRSGAAESPPPSPYPPADTNPMSAPAGTYAIDTRHASIVARVPHQDFSFNVVRFEVTSGTLTWDPARVENSKLTVTANATARSEPIVYGLDLRGPNFMDVARFPTITFVSTGIRRTGPTTGVINGEVTLLGQTRPAAIEAKLVGAGRNNRGVAVVGFTGAMRIDRDDFGLKFVPGANGVIDVVVDAEFNLS